MSGGGSGMGGGYGRPSRAIGWNGAGNMFNDPRMGQPGFGPSAPPPTPAFKTNPQPDPGMYGPQPTGPIVPSPVQMDKGMPQPTYGATTNPVLGQTGGNMYPPTDGWDPPGSFDPGYGQQPVLGMKTMLGTAPGANRPMPPGYQQPNYLWPSYKG